MIIIIILYKYFKNKSEYRDELIFRQQFKSLVDNSYDLIRLLDDTIQRIGTYKFNEFIDGHHMDKINVKHIKELVAEIALEVKRTYNSSWNDIPLYVLYDVDFLNNYISYATTLYVKELTKQYYKDISV